LIVRAVALAECNTEVMVDLSGRKTGEAALKILFSGSTVEPGGEEVVSELLPLVFLHGGKLTLRTTNENRSTFMLILPGKDA
jgi:imidazoleglycerol phosphate dehydratase HisB